ncbi:MAG: hypothetical protein ACNA71_01595 [Kiritimatiellia bacterium]
MSISFRENCWFLHSRRMLVDVSDRIDNSDAVQTGMPTGCVMAAGRVGTMPLCVEGTVVMGARQ